jgi:hypothetical protein
MPAKNRPRVNDQVALFGAKALHPDWGRLEVDNHWEKEIFRLEPRNLVLRGHPLPFGDQETVGCDAQRAVMMENPASRGLIIPRPASCLRSSAALP